MEANDKYEGRPTLKAKMVAADYNYIKETCSVSEEGCIALIRQVHIPLTIGVKDMEMASLEPEKAYD